jgi:hypothetical protein
MPCRFPDRAWAAVSIVVASRPGPSRRVEPRDVAFGTAGTASRQFAVAGPSDL